MHEPELHDLSDDADYAASIQQGSASMTRSDSRRLSSPSEPEGAEVVYSKENVAIHPTQYASERISGRLKLIKQGNSLFMTWIPYKGQSSNARLSEKDKNLYTIRAVPFSDIRSIRRHTPTLGWQYIIVVMSSGLAFPPLYFYNGGVREFLATVKQHVLLVRSVEDANVFLVNDFENPLQRTLSSLELPMAVSVANVPTAALGSTSSASQERGESDKSSSNSQQNGRQGQKHHDPARDISIQVLEKFSLVTRFARETTSQLFRDGLIDGFTPNEGRKHGQISPAYQHITPSNDPPKVPDEVSVAPDPVEFDKLSLVWGKPRQPPLGKEEWATFLDAEGRVMDPKALRKRIFYGGVEHNLRKEVWTFLLGYHAYDSTYAEREYLMSVKKAEYETIKRQWQSISLEQARRFTKFRERKGLIDKDVVRTDRSLSFYDGDDNPNVYLLRDILLTYSFYNFDLGYCQGMSDLLSPILYVMRDESESFWCFVSLMERLGPNFNRDQSGMHTQLFALSKLVELLDKPLHHYFERNDCLNYFFCFRWILIQFK
ncbi:UNVERIFIED_CONTAM: TBC1 domain family member 15, partial [Sesamum calycinum]